MVVARMRATVELDDQGFRQGVTRTLSGMQTLGRAAQTTAAATAQAGRQQQTAAAQTGQAYQALGTRAATALAGIGQRMDVLAAVGRRAMSTLSAGLADAGQRFQQLQARAAAAFAQLSAGAARAGAAIGHLGAPLARIGSLLGAAGGVVSTVTGGGLIGALGAFARRGVDVNLSLGRVEQSLRIMLGSGDRASAVLRQLQKDAAGTTFEFTDLAEHTKKLLAFGFQPEEARRILLTLGDVAFGMAGEEGPNALLERLTLVFGQIRSMGKLLGGDALQLQQAGIPVREILGIQGDIGSADISADQAIDGLLSGLGQRFGGVMAGQMSTAAGRSSNIEDALDAISSRAAKRLTETWTAALGRILDMLTRLLDSGLGEKVFQVLFVPFEALVNVLGKVLGTGDQVLQWIQAVASEESIKLFLTNTIALLETMRDSFLQFFGVDLARLTDPKALNGWFEAFGTGVKAAIDGAFGLGRVFEELAVRIVPGALEDLRDGLQDWADDTRRAFEKMFAGIEASMHSMAASMLDGLVAIAAAVNALPFVEKIDLSAIKSAAAGSRTAADIATRFQRQLDREQAEEVRWVRGPRDADKRARDPFRGTPFGQRIADAFTGSGRDTSAQDAFWARFEQSRLRWGALMWQGLGASTRATVENVGMPPALNLYGRGGGLPSVTTLPAWPGAPAYAPPGGGVVNQFFFESPAFGENPFEDPAYLAALERFNDAWISQRIR